MSKFVTDRLTVNFAYLNKPDDKFGADTANFNVTVPLEDSLSAQIKDAVSKTGAKKVNGVYEKDGQKFIKSRTASSSETGPGSSPALTRRTMPPRSRPAVATLSVSSSARPLSSGTTR